MKISTNLELGKYFTFELSKHRPVYNWFYYKEAFSSEVVEFALQDSGLKTKYSCLLLDPFCGIGTTLLTAKCHKLNAIGFDISPLAVLTSKVKCENYSTEDMDEIRNFLLSIQNLHEGHYDWQFELFSPRTAFPKSNYNALLSMRQAIANVENEKAKNFLLLAILSIVPQISIFIKDGGVLKIDKRKRAIPAKEAFRRKIKRMLQDIEKNIITGPVPKIDRADARQLPLNKNMIDLIVTSPPYLNNIDYTKVYGIELSLIAMDKSITKNVRSESVRSFITSNLPPENVPEELGEIGYKIPVIGNYFSDLEKAIVEIKRVLKPDAACYLVIGNSVVYGTEIFVDELIAAMVGRIGMNAEIIVGAERIADIKPRKVKIRESIIIMQKS